MLLDDRDFLLWIHNRLEDKGDDVLADFMHRLRDVIVATPPGRRSAPCGLNSVATLTKPTTSLQRAQQLFVQARSEWPTACFRFVASRDVFNSEAVLAALAIYAECAEGFAPTQAYEASGDDYRYFRRHQ